MKNNIGIIVQARTGSKRFPGKVLKKLTDRYNVIEFLIKRLKLCKNIKKIIIATTSLKQDNKILKIKSSNVLFFRGSENNVLRRYINAAEKFDLQHIVRITADCPFSDPYLIDKITKLYFRLNLNYISNVSPPSFPNGFDVEIFDLELAKKSLIKFKSKKNKEHVTYAMRNMKMSKILNVKSYNLSIKKDLNQNRLTLDNSYDYKIIRRVVKKITIRDSWKKIYLRYKNL
jgi:spore coat polysaccharide biosynthesis protein SpsF (cytidylyltransferase family)